MRDPPELPGHIVEVLPTVDSTNAEARRRLAAGAAAPGLVLLADAQTDGRGRRGRSWHTVPDRSLAVSLVIPRPGIARLTRLTILAAVAAARALEAAGAPPVRIKWPNDLMRGERKIGGLLVETAGTPGGEPALVLGLGVNLSLRPGDLPEDLAEQAGDAGLDARPATRNAVLASFVAELDAALAELGSAADRARGEEYRARSWLTGRSATLAWDGRAVTATVADVSAEGDLILADGRRAPGEHVQLLDVELR